MFGKNKRGDGSVVLLVFLALLITSIALFVFITKEGNIEERISNLDLLEEVSSREKVLEFHLREILEEVRKEKDADKFVEILGKYKDIQGDYVLKEFEEIERQIDRVRIENGFLVADLEYDIHVSRERGDLKVRKSVIFRYKEKV
jgi:hypothetical protein